MYLRTVPPKLYIPSIHSPQIDLNKKYLDSLISVIQLGFELGLFWILILIFTEDLFFIIILSK